MCYNQEKETGTGVRAKCLEKCDKVSFCVHDEGYRKAGEWALNIKSVVVFGRMKVLEDAEVKKKICENLCLKFTEDQEYIKEELRKYLEATWCLELIPEHMTGKLVNES